MECPKQLETERLGILCFPAKDLVNLVTWATHSSVSIWRGTVAPWHRGTVREALNCKDAFNSGLSSTRTCWELQPGTWRSEPGTLLHVAGPRGFAAATWAQLLEFRIWAFWHTPFWEIAGYLLVSTFRQLMSVPHFQLQVYTLISPYFHVSARFFLLIMQFSCWPTPWKDNGAHKILGCQGWREWDRWESNCTANAAATAILSNESDQYQETFLSSYWSYWSEFHRFHHMFNTKFDPPKPYSRRVPLVRERSWTQVVRVSFGSKLALVCY